MREILFRGKDEDTGEWRAGFIIKGVDDCSKEYNPTIIAAGAYGIGCGWCLSDKIDSYYVVPETVGQYTGLTDKNGKCIFEGDIVTGLFLFELSVNAVVTFQDGAFGLEWYRGNVKTFNAFTSVCNVKYEVIGNIHDNPELLKGV